MAQKIALKKTAVLWLRAWALKGVRTISESQAEFSFNCSGLLGEVKINGPPVISLLWRINQPRPKVPSPREIRPFFQCIGFP